MSHHSENYDFVNKILGKKTPFKALWTTKTLLSAVQVPRAILLSHFRRTNSRQLPTTKKKPLVDPALVFSPQGPQGTRCIKTTTPPTVSHIHSSRPPLTTHPARFNKRIQISFVKRVRRTDWKEPIRPTQAIPQYILLHAAVESNNCWTFLYREFNFIKRADSKKKTKKKNEQKTRRPFKSKAKSAPIGFGLPERTKQTHCAHAASRAQYVGWLIYLRYYKYTQPYSECSSSSITIKKEEKQRDKILSF